VATLTLTKPGLPNQPSVEISAFFQRRWLTDDLADVPLAGTATDADGLAVEASFNGGAYADVGVVASNAWSGTLANQATGVGTLTVRLKTDTGVTDTCELGIGDLFGVQGDSTTVAGPSLTVSAPQRIYYYLGTVGKFYRLDDQTGLGRLTAFGLQWGTAHGVPVAFIGYSDSYSGTQILGHWNPDGSRSMYDTFHDQIADAITAGDTTSLLRAVTVQLGTNSAGLDITPATEEAAYEALVAGNAADIGNAPDTYLWLFGDRDPSGVDAAVYRERMDEARQAIIDAYAGDALRGANLTDCDWPGDHTHPATEADARQIAHRWYLALNGYAGPRVDAVYVMDASTYDVKFDQELGDANDTEYQGFRVMDDGTAVAHTATKTTATRVRLVTDAPCAGTVTVSFASGADAIGGVAVPASVAYALPDTTYASTARIPAEPFFAHAVTEAPTSGRFSTVFSGVLR
jgi:hypothetical protein